MGEVITGARVLKCYAWEPAFTSLVQEVREAESREITRTASLRGLNEGVFFSSSAVVCVVMFSVYVSLGNTLTPRKVFVAFTLMLIISLNLTKFFVSEF